MANLAISLEQEASRLGESIKAVVLGEHYCEESWDRPSEHKGAPIGTVLDWASARPWLDEDYDGDFGGADCRPFYAWTASWVFFVHEYDGAPHWWPCQGTHA